MRLVAENCLRLIVCDDKNKTAIAVFLTLIRIYNGLGQNLLKNSKSIRISKKIIKSPDTSVAIKIQCSVWQTTDKIQWLN